MQTVLQWMSSDLNHSLEPAFIQLTTTAASGEERKFNMMDMQLVQLIVLLIKPKTGVIQRGAGVGKQRVAKELEVGERGTGSWKLWGKSRIRSSTKSYKKEEHKGKQEQIQRVIRFTDYISVSTKYKKFTLFISEQEFHLARLSSQAEQRSHSTSPACSASFEIISIY